MVSRQDTINGQGCFSDWTGRRAQRGWHCLASTGFSALLSDSLLELGHVRIGSGPTLYAANEQHRAGGYRPRAPSSRGPQDAETTRESRTEDDSTERPNEIL